MEVVERLNSDEDAARLALLQDAVLVSAAAGSAEDAAARLALLQDALLVSAAGSALLTTRTLPRRARPPSLKANHWKAHTPWVVPEPQHRRVPPKHSRQVAAAAAYKAHAKFNARLQAIEARATLMGSRNHMAARVSSSREPERWSTACPP